MEKYTLFLDESNDKDKGLIFVAGFAIPNSQLELFSNYILDIKKLIWDEDYINNNTTILHCTELRTIYNNRRNPELYKFISRPEYKIFNKMSYNEIKNTYEKIYMKLCETIKCFDITVFGCKVDEKRFQFLFDTSNRILEDSYNMAIQVIIENFAHFLNQKNGVGYIIYESRNNEENTHGNSPDVKMYENFCKIKSLSKGVPYVNQNLIANRIRYFDIIRKINENPGLEFADFIVFNLFKSFFIGDSKDKTEFMKKIEKRIYNGGFSENVKMLKNFYGIRCIPEDYETINILNDKLARLQRAYKNLKKEKESILSKNKIIKQEKETVKEQNKSIQEENEQLKQEVEALKEQIAKNGKNYS